tara:strand:- start:649 stop:1836 length:1188 start_codon:yes stop_codon:yes gene_type:complete
MTDAASTEMASASEAPEPLASATSADDVVADISHSDYPALEGKTPPMVRTRQQTSGSLAAGTPGFVRVGTRTEVKVPSTPEGITAEWLTQVYRNRGFLRSDGEVKSVTLKPLGDGLGVAGDLCRVLIELSGAAMMDAPTRFVAKFTPREAGLISSVVLKFQFATEAHWYNDMLDDEQGLSRPAAFYVGAKLAHKRFWRIKPVVCMLFEEMPTPLYSVASGISELRHMELVVSMLATLHARWWQKPKKPPIEWVSHPSKDNFGLQLNAFIYAAKSGTAALVRRAPSSSEIPRLADQPAALCVCSPICCHSRVRAATRTPEPQQRRCFPEMFAPILAWAPLIKRRHNYLVKRLFTPPLTLCHGDVHLDNIFFDDSFPGGLKMIGAPRRVRRCSTEPG